MAPQEGPLRVGTGRKNMEREAECSHGEWGIYDNGKRFSDLRQKFLGERRFRRSRILGGLRLDRVWEGAR